MTPNGGATEGGEARAVDGGRAGAHPWHVLWTRSHCERLVHDQLSARGFHPYVPEIDMWTARLGGRRVSRAPLFSGYVFLNDSLDKRSHVEVRKARGLVSILGDGWENPSVVPEREIEGIRRVVDARVPALPHPYLKEGSRVRMVRGPLADLEGILVKVRPDKGLFVLSVDLLQRSVAVEVDCTLVRPA